MALENKFTGERLETFLHNANAVKHLHRYAIAFKYVKNKVVLDIASGEGYGSNLISDSASFVYGVDIDKTAIEKAKNKYRKDNIQFQVGTTSNIPLENESIDVVVSFETLEHHDEHEQMLQEIKRVLRPKGVCIISTPDKHFYSDERNYTNEFHVKELYKSEFIGLVNLYFSNCQILTQSYLNGNSLVLDQINRDKISFHTGDYKNFKETYSPPQFLIAIVSDSDFEAQNNSIFDGSLILKNKTNSQNNLKTIHNSRKYLLRHAILSPLRFLRKGLKKSK